MVLHGVMDDTQRRHDVRPEESCGEECATADYESSHVAPWLVVNAEPAVDTVPNTLPVADFEEGVDEAVYPVIE